MKPEQNSQQPSKLRGRKAPDNAPPRTKKHDHLADRHAHAENRQEALLDEGIEESFPASDPVSVKHIT